MPLAATCPSRLSGAETALRLDALAVVALGLGWLAGLLHPPRAAWIASRGRWFIWALAAGVPLALSGCDALVAFVTLRGAAMTSQEASTRSTAGDHVHLWTVAALSAAAAAMHLRAAYSRGILASFAIPRALLGLYVWASLTIRPVPLAGSGLLATTIYAPPAASTQFHRLAFGVGIASFAEFSEVWSAVVLALGVGLAGHALAA